MAGPAQATASAPQVLSPGTIGCWQKSPPQEGLVCESEVLAVAGPRASLGRAAVGPHSRIGAWASSEGPVGSGELLCCQLSHGQLLGPGHAEAWQPQSDRPR